MKDERAAICRPFPFDLLIPHGICFAKQKDFREKIKSREEGCPPLRDSICTLRVLIVIRMTDLFAGD